MYLVQSHKIYTTDTMDYGFKVIVSFDLEIHYHGKISACFINILSTYIGTKSCISDKYKIL